MERREEMGSTTHTKVSAAQIQVFLKGIDYPAGKQEIIKTAQNNGAPQDVMQYLDRLPEKQYYYPTDVEQEFGKMK